MSTSGGTKAIIAALLANVGIAISKFVAFLITGSSSMLAESVHSVADAGNQALLLLGGRRARRGATTEHPFGYGRDRYFYAFVVALVLFSLGSLFALYEGWHKISDPHELESAGVAIGVLVVAIVLESFSFRTAIVESNRVRGGRSWVQFIRHAKAPELPVVLLEDLGALVGLILALGGVGMTVITDDPVWDGIGTMCIGVLLGIIAVILAFETKSLLMGEAGTPADVRAIDQALRSTPGVTRVIHMRTQHLGPEELLVAAKIEVSSEQTLPQVAATINAAEANCRSAVPIARVIYLEPDVYDPSRPVDEPADTAH